ncbi:NmrA family NAD(P)-binding protein [Hymenobacter latericus]|uniref:NmrA family NAD(P)-binding protein n=1 Tax=Hymenobacter sp. YIM 151858-1 TaxID=2987688 RepID=UPI0022260A81|nr:NmrA family NAD(P)-binding protein [Hymenobacter sp. YIM 151858-1]UYZ60749.1 NmrA family NAD(P)-binding protein [Hymenobacter sp. YIM 151858-1]
MATSASSAPDSASPVVVLAGATGALGRRIAYHLQQRGATVRALVREGSGAKPEAAELRQLGAEVHEVNYGSVAQVARVCAGAGCVVSALSGLREVIVDTQRLLLLAAVEAGVPRFIPSDYCIDYTKLPAGSNRNLDLRREFGQRLDKAPIRATSVLNGMFTDLLTRQAPVILFGPRRVLYWGNPDQPLDFTALDDTAAYTAAAALDAAAPRYLRVAGEVASIRGLQAAAAAATGHEFKLLRAGSLGAFEVLTKLTRALTPNNGEVFPAWQGMQYLHNMFSGLPKLAPLDNQRYPDIRPATVREVLAARQ